MNKLPFFLILLLFLAACQTNDDPKAGDLSTEEAITAIETMSDEASADIIDLVGSEGAESVLNMLDFMFESSEFGINYRTDAQSTKDKALEIARIFATSPAARVGNDDPQYWPKGIYEWSHLEGDFVWVDESDDLILKFPVGESETNNGVFTLSDLEFNVDDLPSLIVATLTVDEVTMVDLHYVVNWSSEGFPEEADIYLFVNPYTFDLNFSTGTTTSLDFTVAHGEEVFAAIHLESNLDINSDELPVVEGSVEYRGVKIAGRVDLAGLDDAVTNETDPNEHVDLSLYIEDNKVGDIVLVLETNDEYTDYVPYVVFEDGTEELLEDLLESFFVTLDDELEAI